MTSGPRDPQDRGDGFSDEGAGEDNFCDAEDPFDPEEYASNDGPRDFDTPPPAASWHGVVQQWSIEGPGPSGYEYLNVAVAITDKGEFCNRWLWDRLSYSPKCAGRWSAFLRALGWRREHGLVNRKNEVELSRLLDAGTVFRFKSKIATDRNGKRKGEIAFYITEQADASPPAQRQADPPAQAPKANVSTARRALDDATAAARGRSQGGRGGSSAPDDEVPF